MGTRTKLQVLAVTGLILLLVIGAVRWLNPYQRRMDRTLAMVREDFPNVPRLQTAQLAAWLDDPKRTPPALYDVRTPEEYEVSHLPGAVRVDPYERTRDLIQKLDTNRTSVLYCSVGYRASQTAEQLMNFGYTNLYSLEGSIFVWANEGRPLESHGAQTQRVHPYSESYAQLLKPERRYSLDAVTSFINEYVPRLDPLRVANATGLLVFFLIWESLAPFFDWFKARRTERTRHGLRNIALGLLNTLVIAFLFARLWLAAANWAAEHQFGLLYWVDLLGWRRVVAAILLLDCWTYFWHRLNHAVPLFWQFHRTHHSELTMDVTSASRFHIGEIIFSSLIRLPLIILLGVRLKELVIYETLMFAVVQFHHANIGLPAIVESVLRWIIVTPNLHRVHHSRWMPETAGVSVEDFLFSKAHCWIPPSICFRFAMQAF